MTRSSASCEGASQAKLGLGPSFPTVLVCYDTQTQKTPAFAGLRPDERNRFGGLILSAPNLLRRGGTSPPAVKASLTGFKLLRSTRPCATR